MTNQDNPDDYGEFDAVMSAFDNQVHWFEHGYHATFRFWKTPTQQEGKHPYRYELVLHDPGGVRIMGYDNAHPIKWKSGVFTKHSENPDHFHRTKSDAGRPYEFVSLTKLLDDFYTRVEQTLRELGIPADITATTNMKG